MVVGHSNAVETGLDDHAGILPFNESKRTCALPADGTCAVNGQGNGARIVGAALALNFMDRT